MRLIVLILLLALGFSPAAAQDSVHTTSPRGFKPAGLPNLNYNSDEGFGYGARVSLYNHGRGGYSPYYYLLDANLFLTTRGRRQAFLFFDTPHLLGRGHRLTAEARYQQYGTAPYYGLGNDTRYRKELTVEGDDAFVNADYFAFKRTRTTLWATYQRAIGAFRGLAGAGLVHTTVEDLEGTTRFALDVPPGRDGGWTNYVKLGLVYDTRDFEPAPSRGDWTDLILSAATRVLGSDYDYTRLTFTNRHYVTLLPRLVFAERIVFEKAWGNIPFYEMAFFESSFRLNEGVGGASTVRGLPQNRLIGPSKLFGNLELRWRLVDFQALRQDFYLAPSAFFDYGRVWAADEGFVLEAFHTGYGGGLHVGWNETFIVTVDAATSDEVDLGIYIGVGYLF